jgi:putative component of membrane protein insertase Oxa1/YidC/SpoIIIJ protein YidD
MKTHHIRIAVKLKLMIKYYLFVLFFINSTHCYLQNNTDLQLLASSDFKIREYETSRKVTYVFSDRKAFMKYNPVSLVFGGSLYVYQKIISPQIQAGCTFDISCSNFSRQSIKKYGILKGVALSADRLTRCTRLSAVDFHPVMINEEGKCIDHPEFYKLRK